MKKFAVFIFVVIALHGNAQDSTKADFSFSRRLIKVSLFPFFANTMELNYESFNASFSKSFQITAGGRAGRDVGWEVNGGYLELAYRKFASPVRYHTRPHRGFYRGIYYSLFAQGGYFEGKSPFDRIDPATGDVFEIPPIKITTAFSCGFTLGFEKTLWRVLYLDAYVGSGIKFANSWYTRDGIDHHDNSFIDPGFQGIFPKFGIKVGVGL